MSRLTDEDLLQIQTFIDRGRRTLEHQGFSIEIDNDLRKWVKLARRAPGAIGAMSTHDPERCHIHPGNAFWVIVRENARRWWRDPLRRKGPIISCLCHRIIETQDILQDIRTHRLFFDKKPSLDFRPVNIVASDNMPVISGRVGLGGGFWVHPKYRGHTVAHTLSRLTRALSLRHFDIDWAIVLVKDTERRKSMIQGIGVPNSVSVIKGYYPPHGADRDTQLGYMHRDEILRQISEENFSETVLRPGLTNATADETPLRQREQRPATVGGSAH